MHELKKKNSKYYYVDGKFVFFVLLFNIVTILTQEPYREKIN